MRSNAPGSKELSSRLTDCLLMSGVMRGKCCRTRPKVEAQPGEFFENQDRPARLRAAAGLLGFHAVRLSPRRVSGKRDYRTHTRRRLLDSRAFSIFALRLSPLGNRSHFRLRRPDRTSATSTTTHLEHDAR